MRVRKTVETAGVVLLVAFGAYAIVSAVFPRLHNDLSCSDSTPANEVEKAALEDARSRAPAACSGPQKRCMFSIDGYAMPDGFLRIRPIVVETDFFDGCVYTDDSLDTFVYQRGKFLKTEQAQTPYALD